MSRVLIDLLLVINQIDTTITSMSEIQPGTTPDFNIPVFMAPKAFSMFGEISTGIHHDAFVLGQLALEIESEFGQNYGMKAPIEKSVLIYRFGAVGPFQAKAEPHIKRAKPDAPYYDAKQLSIPAYEGKNSDFISIPQRNIVAIGTPHDIWTGPQVTQPLLRKFLESMLYPGPDNEGPMAKMENWVAEIEGALPFIAGRKRSVTPAQKEQFISDALRRHSDAITLDLQ